MKAIKISSKETREFWEIPVLYEDEHLLALDKPAGLLTFPETEVPGRANLLELLHAAIAEGKPWVRERGLEYLMNPERLDFETSGVLLLAKGKSVLGELANQFGSEKPGRRYLVLVEGAPREPVLEIDYKLASDSVRSGFMRVDPKHGKRARTAIEVVERFTEWSLLRCQLLTNRPHQLRAHLRYIRCPIVGDREYGGSPLWLSALKRGYRRKEYEQEKPLLARSAAHSECLTFVHPVKQEEMTICAPLPRDLEVSLKYLRRYSIGPESTTESPDISERD